MLDADGGEAVSFVVNFDVAEDVWAFSLEGAGDLDGEQADFGIGVQAAAESEET